MGDSRIRFQHQSTDARILIPQLAVGDVICLGLMMDQLLLLFSGECYGKAKRKKGETKKAKSQRELDRRLAKSEPTRRFMTVVCFQAGHLVDSTNEVATTVRLPVGISDMAEVRTSAQPCVIVGLCAFGHQDHADRTTTQFVYIVLHMNKLPTESLFSKNQHGIYLHVLCVDADRCGNSKSLFLTYHPW